MLCSLCSKIEKTGLGDFDPEIEQWWAAHRKKDAERKKKEQSEKKEEEDAKNALKKLTPRERKLLGL
jgi:FixJ family two-component response regulator